MKRVFIITISIYFLSSCSNSNGKIELRETKSGCLILPERIFRDPNELDTSGGIDKNFISKNPKLKLLYESKETLEKESKSAFLINTFSSDAISFTIKSTASDTFETSSTQIYKTNPGEEVFIGCASYLNDNYEVIKKKFEIVGEKKNK